MIGSNEKWSVLIGNRNFLFSVMIIITIILFHLLVLISDLPIFSSPSASASLSCVILIPLAVCPSPVSDGRGVSLGRGGEGNHIEII
jgi:hypothetical protein